MNVKGIFNRCFLELQTVGSCVGWSEKEERIQLKRWLCLDPQLTRAPLLSLRSFHLNLLKKLIWRWLCRTPSDINSTLRCGKLGEKASCLKTFPVEASRYYPKGGTFGLSLQPMWVGQSPSSGEAEDRRDLRAAVLPLKIRWSPVSRVDVVEY